MEKEEALRSLLQMLAAVVQINSDFCAAAAAYMRRRRDILRARQRLLRRRNQRPAAERRFWVRPGRSTAWWDNFTSGAAAPEEWRENFRMSREALLQLSDRLRPHVQGETTKMRAPVDVLTKVACTLFYLSDEGRLRKTADAFGLSRSSVSVFIRQVCRAVSVFLGPDYIRTPSSQQEVEDLVRGFSRAHGLPQCLGAVDCTHVAVKQPALRPSDYINAAGAHSLNVHALCDYKSCFLDVVVRWPGGAHDARIFAESKLSADLRDGTIPPCPRELLQGEAPVPVYLLGDAAFPLRPRLMKEYPAGGETPAERRFSRTLCGAHTAIRTALGRLKARFGALRRAMDINMDALPFVIHACFVLHNYCEASGEAVSERSLDAALRHERDAQPPASVSEETAEQDAEGQAVRRVLTKFLDT
ncbi:putative nuclease HARBI1 isoform X2 [Sander lucioperca]|uniref:putative nuclease HARBI1 isoform X2 n=1 Tax=Sander lucioperca TaxID=283035 RepID=UPI0016536ABE|nr:putative nuclease HARBI1 isoform X2 [Sander lucioperca]